MLTLFWRRRGQVVLLAIAALVWVLFPGQTAWAQG
jgi:hypothetical protein